ncbi:MAG: 4,5-DOPA dioxygenase extradiol [Chloroflexi bacterium]|nr:4,5-DOPA dioxygenase extradiol [Chloroflexota bacterium]MBV9134510.1 4,5-DOPA dioxygenase extradiol [Chloroflexota bacterium]
MPAVFIGHGTPFNALQNNRFTQAWAEFGSRIPKPKAILAVSAHWYIGATAATAMPKPPTVHDFYGFPAEMYQIAYPAPGAPELVPALQDLIAPVWLEPDKGQWGLDHGTWSVLVHMFPEADVPVVQLSIDGRQPAAYHLELGKRLAPLRDQGVLVMGSGNIVHNLRLMNRSLVGEGPEWASRFDAMVQDYVFNGEDRALVDYERQPDCDLAIPTPDHYLPLLYTVGVRQNDDTCEVIVDGLDLGCVSMTSYQFR